MIFFYGAAALIALEITAFILIGEEIGLFATFFLCFASAALGVMIMQHQGLGLLSRLRQSLEHGLFPMDEMFDGLCLMMAGMLLILPGFLSDLIAFILLLPLARKQIKSVLAAHYGESSTQSPETDSGIIEGEYIRIFDDKSFPPRDIH